MMSARSWSKGLVVLAALASCRTTPPAELPGAPSSGRRAEEGLRCLPITSRRPIPVDGGVCGDGVAGGPCEEVEVFSCREHERGKSIRCNPLAEPCDGADLRGLTCESVGLSGTGLRCRPTCNDFDTSACDRCPRRPGVRCVDLPLPAGTFAFTSAVAPSGAVCVLGIHDEGGVVFHLRSPRGATRAVRAPAGFDPRALVAAGPDSFLAMGERAGRQYVVARVSFEAGVGPIRAVDAPPGTTAPELLGAGGRAWLVTRASWRGRVVAAVPLDSNGAVVPPPAAATLLGSVVVLPTDGGACFAQLRDEPEGCDLEGTSADGQGVASAEAHGTRTLDLGACGRLTAAALDGGCTAEWTGSDAVARLRLRRPGPPPAMHGVDGWAPTSAGWVGHRLGLLVFVGDAGAGDTR